MKYDMIPNPDNLKWFVTEDNKILPINTEFGQRDTSLFDAIALRKRLNRRANDKV